MAGDSIDEAQGSTGSCTWHAGGVRVGSNTQAKFLRDHVSIGVARCFRASTRQADRRARRHGTDISHSAQRATRTFLLYSYYCASVVRSGVPSGVHLEDIFLLEELGSETCVYIPFTVQTSPARCRSEVTD